MNSEKFKKKLKKIYNKLTKRKVIKKKLLGDRYDSNQWDDLEPVWFLSTGRAGTMLLQKLLEENSFCDVYHEPTPNMFKFTSDYWNGFLTRHEALTCLKYLRDEMVHRSFYNGKIYIETNNRCTYIAEILLERFVKSKFVHVYREPYDLILSGIRRNWYQDNNCDHFRIRPLEGDSYFDEWNYMNQMEKIAWYWMKVNLIALDFSKNLKASRFLSFPIERLFKGDYELIEKLFHFIGDDSKPSEKKIRKIISKKVNAQKTGTCVKKEHWSKQQLDSVNHIVRPVSDQLGYELRSHFDDIVLINPT